MPVLKALSVGRYRSFRDRTTLPIAPLITLIGRNGSGKSVLSRLPLILADALHSGQLNEPINLMAGGVRHGLSYNDVSHMQSSLPFNIGAEAEENNVSFAFDATLRFVREREAIIVESYSLLRDGKEIFNIALHDEKQLVAPSPTYTAVENESGQSWEVAGFVGLVPQFLGSSPPHWDDALGCFLQAIPAPYYLGPLRAEVGHFIGSPRQDLFNLGPRGENTVEVLSSDKARSGGRLLGLVTQWFERTMGQSVLLTRNESYSTIQLQPANGSFSVHLAETGAGFSQLLPIVTQNMICQLHAGANRILVVEQPELHLHPGIHGELTDLFINTVQSSNCTAMIETHSEQMIMRLRRRIAEEFDPKSAVVWSVGHAGPTPEAASDFKQITFDKAGSPSDWPLGVFEESFDDLSKMRNAARQRGL